MVPGGRPDEERGFEEESEGLVWKLRGGVLGHVTVVPLIIYSSAFRQKDTLSDSQLNSARLHFTRAVAPAHK